MSYMNEKYPDLIFLSLHAQIEYDIESTPFLNSSGAYTLKDRLSGEATFEVDTSFIISTESDICRKLDVSLSVRTGRLGIKCNNNLYVWCKHTK